MGRPLHHNAQPVIELVRTVDRYADGLENARTALTLMAGSEAFRRFDWLRKIPIQNSSGNLRGMVVSARWRAVYVMSSETLEKIGQVATIASFASALAEQADDIETVISSRDSVGLKSLQLASIAGTAAERTLAGIVTGPASLLFLSLQGYCQIAGAAGASKFGDSCVAALKGADAQVQSTVKTFADTKKQGDAIYQIVTKFTAPGK